MEEEAFSATRENSTHFTSYSIGFEPELTLGRYLLVHYVVNDRHA